MQDRARLERTHSGVGVGPARRRGDPRGAHERLAIKRRLTVLTDLEEFVRDHQPHGGMTGDATKPASNGYRLTVACACGVVFDRWVTPEEADADQLRLAALN